MVPIGFAGVLLGIFDITQGNPAGIVVALLGASAATLAIVKLRSRRQND